MSNNWITGVRYYTKKAIDMESTLLGKEIFKINEPMQVNAFLHPCKSHLLCESNYRNLSFILHFFSKEFCVRSTIYPRYTHSGKFLFNLKTTRHDSSLIGSNTFGLLSFKLYDDLRTFIALKENWKSTRNQICFFFAINCFF